MFQDWDRVPDWLKPLAKVAVERGLIDGYPDGTLRVEQGLTRAEYIAGLARVAIMAEELVNHDRRDLVRKIASASVEIRSGAGLGSGVVVAPGKVITNAHVVGNEASVLVRWTSPHADPALPQLYGPRYTVAKRNVDLDLALIDVPVAIFPAEIDPDWAGPDLNAVDRAHDSERLYTLGSPAGMQNVLSTGLFAGHKFYNGLFLLFSGATNPGNSGGGVFNTAGKVVGINSQKPLVPDGSGGLAPADNLALCVPVIAINHFLKEA